MNASNRNGKLLIVASDLLVQHGPEVGLPAEALLDIVRNTKYFSEVCVAGAAIKKDNLEQTATIRSPTQCSDELEILALPRYRRLADLVLSTSIKLLRQRLLRADYIVLSGAADNGWIIRAAKICQSEGLCFGVDNSRVSLLATARSRVFHQSSSSLKDQLFHSRRSKLYRGEVYDSYANVFVSVPAEPLSEEAVKGHAVGESVTINQVMVPLAHLSR